METPQPGSPVRGSRTGRPIMALFDVLGQRWTLRILWELRDGRMNFRPLRASCGGISPTVLNKRLKMLRNLKLLDLSKNGYGYTEWGRGLSAHLLELRDWSNEWAEALPEHKIEEAEQQPEEARANHSAIES